MTAIIDVSVIEVEDQVEHNVIVFFSHPVRAIAARSDASLSVEHTRHVKWRPSLFTLEPNCNAIHIHCIFTTIEHIAYGVDAYWSPGSQYA